MEKIENIKTHMRLAPFWRSLVTDGEFPPEEEYDVEMDALELALEYKDHVKKGGTESLESFVYEKGLKRQEMFGQAPLNERERLSLAP